MIASCLDVHDAWSFGQLIEQIRLDMTSTLTCDTSWYSKAINPWRNYSSCDFSAIMSLLGKVTQYCLSPDKRERWFVLVTNLETVTWYTVFFTVFPMSMAIFDKSKRSLNSLFIVVRTLGYDIRWIVSMISHLNLIGMSGRMCLLDVWYRKRNNELSCFERCFVNVETFLNSSRFSWSVASSW